MNRYTSIYNLKDSILLEFYFDIDKHLHVKCGDKNLSIKEFWESSNSKNLLKETYNTISDNYFKGEKLNEWKQPLLNFINDFIQTREESFQIVIRDSGGIILNN